jgi:hypothetical protein
MDLVHARALLPDGQAERAIVTEHKPQRDAKALEKLALWATRFSPIVAVEEGLEHREPDGLMLDITGCEHLFGGEAALIAHLMRAVERLGFTCRAAGAGTVGCAWAVARFLNAEVAESEERRRCDTRDSNQSDGIRGLGRCRFERGSSRQKVQGPRLRIPIRISNLKFQISNVA